MEYFALKFESGSKRLKTGHRTNRIQKINKPIVIIKPSGIHKNNNHKLEEIKLNKKLIPAHIIVKMNKHNIVFTSFRKH